MVLQIDFINENTIERLRKGGVIFLATTGVYIEDTVKVAAGATIMPGTLLRGTSEIGAGAVIGPNALVQDSYVGENVVFNSSQIYDSRIEKGAKVGPFAHIRPGSVIGENAKVGNFVEVKNSNIGRGASVAHLTYIGDSDVGAHSNIGCGVVTVNYDGEAKYRTTIGENAFIGCNTNLIAPVTIGEGAYTAAGSTITQDVPSGALGISRTKTQTNIEGWAEKKLAKYKAKHVNNK